MGSSKASAKQDKNGTIEADLNVSPHGDKRHYRRSIVSFWIFGVSSHFAFWVMMSAGLDILNRDENDIPRNDSTFNASKVPDLNGNGSQSLTVVSNASAFPPTKERFDNYLVCNPINTGILLLVEIPIATFVKSTFPFFSQKLSYNLKVPVNCALTIASFLLIAYFHETLTLSIIGMAIVCLAASLGDIIYFGLTTFYHKNVVSAWCSGTGASGLLSSFAYAGMTSLGMSLHETLLVMVSVPIILLCTYLFVLGKPLTTSGGSEGSIVDDSTHLVDQTKHKKLSPLTMKQKFRILPSLCRYMGPMSTVYFFQYFINQGLYELMYFNHFYLSKNEQYRWYQFTYHLGSFIGRSTVNIYHIKNLWFMPLLQFSNVCLLLLHVFFRFLPSFWIVLLIALWEGLIGGTTFVNTYFKLSSEVPENEKEFSIGMSTFGDSTGISLAGAVSVPLHNAICHMHLKMP